MKATFKNVRVGSKIENSLGTVLTVKEVGKDNIVIATWSGRGEMWIFGSQLKDYELVRP